MNRIAVILASFLVAGGFAMDEESEQHEWESSLHVPVKWEALNVIEAVSQRGRLERLPDGSLREPKDGAEREIYTIRAAITLRGITAFRVEVIPENGSVGRGGKAVLIEFGVARSETGKAEPFACASADFARRGCGPQMAIDGDLRTGWGLEGAADKVHAAAFQLEKSIDGGPDATLVFTLSQTADGGSLKRFRISATTHAPPVLELPEAILQTIALEPSERSGEQRKGLTEFFESTRTKPKDRRIAP